MTRPTLWTSEFCEGVLKNGFPKGLSPEYVRRKLREKGFSVPDTMLVRTRSVWDEKDFCAIKELVETHELFKRHSIQAVANKLIALSLRMKEDSRVP